MLVAELSDPAAVGRVDLNVPGNDPVTHPDLKKRATPVLPVGLGDQPGFFSELRFAAQPPGQSVFLVFTLTGVAQVGVQNNPVIGQ